MGRPYKKGICERCKAEGYVNDHHVIPEHIKKKNNKTTIRLCLNCHVEIHEKLPDEPQEESFYILFTKNWILGLLSLLLMLFLIHCL